MRNRDLPLAYSGIKMDIHLRVDWPTTLPYEILNMRFNEFAYLNKKYQS